ncbi:MAG: hypothetical protein V7739_07845 [Motiliproteus sp.]
MRMIRFVVILLSMMISIPTSAFTTNDERIDHYLKILNSPNLKRTQKMVERLQWSGVSDPRLFDDLEKRIFEHYLDEEIDGRLENLLAHMVRALGYSGNEKYRVSLAKIIDKTPLWKLEKHAKKALVDLDMHSEWNELVAASSISVEGKSIEVSTYMKMLDVDDILLQRMAARAIYNEHHNDSELLDLAANKLKLLYMEPGLDKISIDAAAWLIKAIGQSGESKYAELLTEVASATPYEKIGKYAVKFSY